jgi:hypothetical protein
MTKKPLSEHIFDQSSAIVLVQSERDEALHTPHETSSQQVLLLHSTSS